jgi:hypothetical protein
MAATVSALLKSQPVPKITNQSAEGSSLSSGVTRMLVLVTSVFLLTTLPACLYYIVDSYLRDEENEEVLVNKVSSEICV